MARAKRRRQAEVFTYGDQGASTATRIYASSSGRHVKSRREEVATASTTPQDQTGVPGSQDPCEDALGFMGDEFPPTMCDEVAGVQIIPKAKSKRYDSSVSH